MLPGSDLPTDPLRLPLGNHLARNWGAHGALRTTKAAAISYYAIDHNLALKPAALAKGVSEELYDKVVVPINLTRPGTADVPATTEAAGGH